jgi:6-phosphogluconolactonase
MQFRLIILSLLISVSCFSQKYFLFIGTYTANTSKGIYVYEFDAKTGETKWLNNTDSASNPSFLTIAPDGKHVYAVNEVSRQQAGFVASYAFDAATAKLTFVNKQSSGSENPCHISISKDGKWLMAANYTGGTLASFPVNADGSIAPFAQHIIHTGKSVDSIRQDRPHVHSVFFSPDEKYLLTPDLGTDQISVYQFHTKSAQPLRAANPAYFTTEPGSGPRHLCFAPNGKKLYVITEMGGSVSVFDYKNGQANFAQQIATHPSAYTGQPGSADIHITPNGKFLYASNRGKENNIAIFSVAPDGLLSSIGYESTRGEGPRNFNIDPTGNFLLVANQKTGNIEVFKINKNSGLLTHTGTTLHIANPVCIKFFPKP